MIGRTVSHYRILEKLGEGGMGVVYRAEDTALQRTVALKFLPPELTRDAEAKQRFLHEARAAARLDHPNICTVHEVAESADGQLFIVLACYEGETLRDKIRRGPVPWAEAAGLALQAAAGLAHAHGKGIVHRDIKPANMFVTADGTVKILDFGLAKLAGASVLTKDGRRSGPRPTWRRNRFGGRRRTPGRTSGRWGWCSSRWWRGGRLSPGSMPRR